jgi:protein-tyrosine phosphatase
MNIMSWKDWKKTGMEYTVNTYPAQYVINATRSVVQPYMNDKFEANKVCDNVYVGNFASACDRKMLKQFGFKNIVVVAYGLWEMYPEDFNYKRIDVIDSEYSSLEPYFNEISKFIYDAAINRNEKVLIHCVAGVSRSGAIAVAYLVLTQNLTVEQALYKIRQWRPKINPNPSFMNQLKQLEPNDVEVFEIPLTNDYVKTEVKKRNWLGPPMW